MLLDFSLIIVDAVCTWAITTHIHALVSPDMYVVFESFCRLARYFTAGGGDTEAGGLWVVRRPARGLTAHHDVASKSLVFVVYNMRAD